jgi:hypothetical protein
MPTPRRRSIGSFPVPCRQPLQRLKVDEGQGCVESQVAIALASLNLQHFLPERKTAEKGYDRADGERDPKVEREAAGSRASAPRLQRPRETGGSTSSPDCGSSGGWWLLDRRGFPSSSTTTNTARLP